MEDNEATYGLIVAFPDGSASFVNGFEAGRVNQLMIDFAPEIELTAHSENEEVFQRMAIAFGYDFSAEKTEYEEWIVAKFKKTSVQNKNNPFGLRIVK